MASEQGSSVTRRAGATTEDAAAGSGTAASIESARRFLYDEDEGAPQPGNIPLPPTHFKEKKRLNPIVAACMATCSTCRGFGLKRLCYGLALIGGIMLLAWGISGLTREEREHVRKKHIRKVSEQLVDAGITTSAKLTEEGTPQYHALNWLVNVDKKKSGDPYLEQRFALAVLFYSNSDDLSHHDPDAGWENQDSWMTSKGICMWYGVECQLSPQGPIFDGDGAVTSLNLTSNDMVGELPMELVGLNELLTLDLSDNDIQGILHNDFVKLTSLRYFILRNNDIQGTIPAGFGNFASLRQLHLGGNSLEGSIPTELQHVATLKALGLEQNEFTGNIPGFEDLHKLST